MAHFWLAAAFLVANGVCEPTFKSKPSEAQKRAAYAKAVAELALELADEARASGRWEIEP